MRRLHLISVGTLVLVLLAAVLGGSSPQSAKPAPPKFDGNLASLDWGGKIESATGLEPGDDRATHLIDGQPTSWGSDWEGPPKEIVVSFFEHEPALVSAVLITSEDDPTPANAAKEVEIYTSMTSPTEGFAKVAAATLPAVADQKITFSPVEAKFVKIRLVKNQSGGTRFELREIKVIEGQRAGYVPLLTRRPEIMGPLAPGAGGTPPTVAAAGPACQPATAAPQPGRDKSRKVMVLTSNTAGTELEAYDGFRIKHDRKEHTGADLPDLAVVDDITMQLIRADFARPWHLADKQGFDTVVLEQACGEHTSMTALFTQALVPWVAAGHKLIIHDADKCVPGPDYSWLPFRIKTDNPGAQGARGDALKIVEDNWMVHNLRGRPGFVNTTAWLADAEDYRNELGDSNVFTAWDPNWCGHIVVKNVAGVFGFTQAYAHYGRGLIIYGGIDVDMAGTTGYDLMIARELAQGFNPDNLPCSTRLGSFAVTTEPQFVTRDVQPGQAVTYPLTLLSILKYKGNVTLSATTSPAVAGLQARFDPATVAVSDEHKATLTLTLPAGMKPAPVAIEVKGTATDGKTSTLCLQTGPPTGGALAVVSAVAALSKTRKNLEIILDASGSMKMLMDKKSRWDTALDTLQQVLAKVPDDFDVGLRIYGHREPSTSPKTCTDSELVVPIQALDRQAILARAKAYQPKGETPLVYSALQAPADLKGVGGGTVILITDGEESCKGDPVKAAAELKASGLDIRLNIVGFAVTDPKIQKDLAGFAQATNGRFYAAQSGQALADALLVAAVEKFPYEVFDTAGGQVVAGEAGGASSALPPGNYKVVVKAGATELVAPRVTITLGQTTTLRILLKGDQLILE